jgi:hypothetical protein
VPVGDRPRQRGLAHAGLAFEEEGTVQSQREVAGDRQPTVGEIALHVEEAGELRWVADPSRQQPTGG